MTLPFVLWTAASAGLALAAGGATWAALFPFVPRDLGGARDLDELARHFRIPVPGTNDAVDAWYLPGTRPAHVLVLHGFGREHSRSWRYAGFMHRAGFGVLTIDFRSSRRRGNRLPTTLGHHELPDARAALAWLCAQPAFAGHRFGVFGESLGGAVAIMAAAEEPRVAAVVVDCAFASGRHALEDSSERWARLPGGPTALLARGVGRAFTGYDPGAIDVLGAAARLVQKPVYFIHSLNDRRLSPRQAGLLWRAAGCKDPLWLVPGGHNEAWKRHPREYERRVLAFLEAHLGNAAAVANARAAAVATTTWTGNWSARATSGSVPPAHPTDGRAS